MSGDRMVYRYLCDSSQIDRIYQVLGKFLEYVESRPEQHGQKASFSSGYLNRVEGYKEAVYVHATDILQPKTWNEKDVISGKVAELAKRAMMISDNNFVDYHQKIRFSNKIDENPVKAGELLYDLYVGKKSDKDNIEALAAFFGRYYDIIAYLFFLKAPDRYFPCVKTPFRDAFAELHLDTDFFGPCVYENYKGFCNTILELTDLFYNYGWKISPIDVHSFLWIIAPHKNAYEDIHAYIFDDNGGINSPAEDNSAKKERKSLVNTRVNQTEFRRNLMEYWDGSCSVTGCTKTDMLKASHIKPWRDCTLNTEAINVYNGFLLTPNLDAAFDSGYISFDDRGKIMISDELSQDDCNKLGITSDMKLRRIEPEHQRFLKYHRENIFGSTYGSNHD